MSVPEIDQLLKDYRDWLKDRTTVSVRPTPYWTFPLCYVLLNLLSGSPGGRRQAADMLDGQIGQSRQHRRQVIAQ